MYLMLMTTTPGLAHLANPSSSPNATPQDFKSPGKKPTCAHWKHFASRLNVVLQQEKKSQMLALKEKKSQIESCKNLANFLKLMTILNIIF